MLPEITALRYHSDGLTWAVGTSSGHVLLYDLRAGNPLIAKDHQYGQPIKDIKFHPTSGHVFSADSKILKIWDPTSGDIYTSIEPSSDINDVCIVGGSGLVLFANEEPRMHAYYVPSIGPAPYWCSFLDNLTEELEETKQTTVYDDYKFVTRKELASLGLDHLVGTPMLRAYMHGFFINQKLYQKAQAIANPFQYEEYRKRMLTEKLAKENASRISLQRRLPKINRELAQRLLGEAETERRKRKQVLGDDDAVQMAANPLRDDRFRAMFNNPEFAIDTDSAEYQSLHPSLRGRFQHVPGNSMDNDDSDDHESEAEGHGSDQSSAEDSDDDLVAQVHKKTATSVTHKKGTNNSRTASAKPAFYELQDGVSVKTVMSADAMHKMPPRQLSFGQRLNQQGRGPSKPARNERAQVGPMEYRFNLPDNKKKAPGPISTQRRPSRGRRKMMF